MADGNIAINDYNATSAHMSTRKAEAPALGYLEARTIKLVILKARKDEYISVVYTESLTANLASTWRKTEAPFA